MIPHFSLRQLAYFVALAESSTISDAARRLYVSESTVAASLDALEKDYGVRLCIRQRSRGISLTPAGRQFAHHARQILQAAKRFEGELRGSTGAISGPVAVGCLPSAAPIVLARLMAMSTERYPEIDFQFTVGDRAELLTKLRQGSLDSVILVGPKTEQGLTQRTIHSWRPQVIMSPDHHLAHQEAVSLTDLADEPFILLDTEESIEYSVSLFAAAGVTPNTAYRTGSFELLRSLVARGFGYSLHVLRPAGDLSYEGLPLAIADLIPQPTEEHIYIGWLQNVPLTKQAETVVELARAMFRQSTATSAQSGVGST